MRKRAAKLLVALAVLACVGAALGLWLGREPTYQGKTASAWFRIRYESRQANKTVTTLPMPTGPMLVEFPGDPDPEVLTALRALGTNAVSYLVATILRSDSRFDRVYWRAVGLVPSWLQWLVPKPVPKSWLATEAAAILPELGPAARSAIPALVASLKTGKPLLNHAARDALGRMRPRFDELAPCLGELARQGDYATVCALIQDLHFRGSATVPLLCEALRTTDRQARRTALMLLEQQGPNAARAVPLLVTTLQDPDSEVRYLTARTLGEIGTIAQPALEALKRACDDTNVMVQNASRRAIGKIAPGEDHPASSDEAPFARP